MKESGVYSIWESRFGTAADGGRAVTRRIWQDMLDFDGYISHELLEDVTEPGHLLVISRWSSRQAADEALRAYATNPNAIEANRLVAEPRRRIVAVPLDR